MDTSRMRHVLPHRICLCLAAAMLAGACSSVPPDVLPPQVSISGIDIAAIDLFEQHYRIRVRLQNPNDHSLPLDGFSYALALNGQTFAEGVSRHPVRLPARGGTIMEVDATGSTGSLIRHFSCLWRNGFSVSYALRGEAWTRGGGHSFPFEQRGEIPFGELLGPAGDGALPKRPATLRENVHL